MADHNDRPQRRGDADDVHCRHCSLRSLCLPQSLDDRDLERFNAIVRRPGHFKKGSLLAREGAPLHSLLVVRSGSLKQVSHTGGREQLTRFFLPGELVGLDGLDTLRYPGSVRALEAATICDIPYPSLDTLATQLPDLRTQLFRSMSRTLREDRLLMGHCRPSSAWPPCSASCRSAFAAAATPPTAFVFPSPAPKSAATWALPWKRSVACSASSSSRAW